MSFIKLRQFEHEFESVFPNWFLVIFEFDINTDGFDKLVHLVKHASNHKKKLGRNFPLLRVSYYPSPETTGEEQIFVNTFKNYVDFIDIQEFKDIRDLGNHDLRDDCRMPFRRLAIFADGRVAPCCSLYSNNVIVGNINEQSLKEIWDGEKINTLREELLSNNPRAICKTCLSSIGSVEIWLRIVCKRTRLH